jgi:hypothetical protein
MARAARALALALILTGATQAHAGRTHFGWLYDTETLPQLGVELETWIQEENKVDDEATLFWWAPVVGVIDRIEIAVPIALKLGVTPAGATFGFNRFGLEGRFKLTNPDPVEAGPFSLLIRAGGFRLVGERGQYRLELGVVAALDVGRVHLTLDAESVLELGNRPVVFELEPGLGISVRIVDQFRLGAEVASSFHLDGSGQLWIAAGPNLSWTLGRFWLSGSFLIGITGITTAPRINFAVAF